MILISHLLFAAAIAQKIPYAPLAIILAFLSHYFLDIIPHIEYSIENITNKKWKKALPDFLKVFLDFASGIILILIFSTNQPIIFVGAFAGIISDGLSLLGSVFPNKILKAHSSIHQEKIHFLKHKKFSNFWRISSQVLIIVISIIILKS